MKIASRAAPIALLILLAANASAYDFNTVFVGGRPDPNSDSLGPQLGPGVDWSSDTPARWYMNEAGQTAFNGLLTGADAAADTGIWRWTNGQRELLAREGGQVPVLPAGVEFNEFSSIYGMSISSDGSVMFSGFLRGTGVDVGSNESYMLANPDGTLTVIAREGDPAAGFNPSTFTTYQPELQLANPIFQHPSSTPLLAPDGELAIDAQIIGIGSNASNNRLIYSNTSGNLQIIAREGDAAPGAPVGSILGPALFPHASGGGGHQLFGGEITHTDESRHRALYRYDSGTYTLIATDESPTGLPGRSFVTFSNPILAPQINGLGDVTFSGLVSGVTEEDPREEVLYKAPAGSAAGTFKLLVGPGLSAPGTGATFSTNPADSFVNVQSVLNASGDVAFMYNVVGSTVTTANDSGIWINDPLGTRLAIREGDAAGNLSGATIGTLRQFTFNDNQNLIVISDLVGAVTSGVDRAMWWVQADGTLELLLREGDLFDVDPSAGIENRTISDLRLGGYLSASGLSSSFGAFNDADQLAFMLSFTDGSSGLFVTDLSPVPEPSSGLLVGCGITSLVALRRRNR